MMRFLIRLGLIVDIVFILIYGIFGLMDAETFILISIAIAFISKIIDIVSDGLEN